MKFRKFIEIFYCCMNRLRNTNLGVFIPYKYTRTILRNKNMEESLFKKHSKFQNFDEIFHCCMAKLRKTNLGVFIQCQYTRTILREKSMGQSLCKKHSKFKISMKYFTHSWPGSGTRTWVFLYNVSTQELL